MAWLPRQAHTGKCPSVWSKKNPGDITGRGLHSQKQHRGKTKINPSLLAGYPLGICSIQAAGYKQEEAPVLGSLITKLTKQQSKVLWEPTAQTISNGDLKIHGAKFGGEHQPLHR